MKCFYHKSDLDGHCAGAIVKEAYPECEMIGVDYNDPLDLNFIQKGEIVYVVDFSFSLEEMVDLDAKAALFWIDHHKTAIEKMAEYHGVIMGLRQIGLAGCELTWMYLHGEHSAMPSAVALLGRYDVWDHTNSLVLPFQYGVRTVEDTLPGAAIWEKLLSIAPDSPGIVSEIAHTGQIILDYQRKQDAMYAKGMAYEGVFRGLRAIIMNKAYNNSKAFDEVYDPEKHEIMVSFGVKPGEWKYSLYSDKEHVDCGAIAKELGGGGHKGAAGFYSKNAVLDV